jgi:hypothetical protein
LITGEQSNEAALLKLAGALLLDHRLNRFHLVVRHSTCAAESTALYLFGEAGALDMERLKQLAAQISHTGRSARYIGYREAEALAEILAEQLSQRYGRSEVQGFEYRAIPRGGLIVLGMLSYALGLPAARLSPENGAAGRPVVCVDDCVLSGMRFKEQLLRLKGRQVILASLFAPAALCGSQESEVEPFECICATALRDLGPELYGDAYPAWRQRWAQRQGDAVLWIGQPEHLCFAWSEPESSFYNSVNGSLEPGFLLAPPERCLRHRNEQPNGPAESLKDRPQVHFHEDGPGPLHAAPRVVAVRIDANRVAVADFSAAEADTAAECYLLEGSAADMWEHILVHGTVERASQALSKLYDAEPRILSKDTADFADSLLDLEILVRG